VSTYLASIATHALRTQGEKTSLRTDLKHKSCKIKGVVIHHDPSHISNDGVGGAGEHAHHEPPLLPPDAEVHVD